MKTSDEVRSFTVEADDDGIRVDRWFKRHLPQVGFGTVSKWARTGQVRVDGKRVKPDDRLEQGQQIRVPPGGDAPHKKEKTKRELKPAEIEQAEGMVITKTKGALVLNKPPGLVVHPAAGNESGTLVNALLFHDSVFKSVERAGMVHRLDKDTSGVMVVAKTAAALAELQRQFKARETGKEYLALVWRHPPARGRIENLIGRHPVHRKKMAVLKEGGRGAVSSFEVQETFAEAALVRVKIETGRTHQIRVHMAHLGHPIVGDSVYGRARKQKLPVDAQRQMLHAFRLEFTHPATGKRLSFEAPLFDDMRHLLELLRD